MSEYTTKELIEDASKILDAAIDFNKIFPNKKILGIIKIGSVLERYDRKLFKLGLTCLVESAKKQEEPKIYLDEITKAFGYLRNQDIQGFSDYVAGVLAGEINIPFIEYDKQIYLGILMTFNGYLGKVIKHIDSLIAEANAEA